MACSPRCAIQGRALIRNVSSACSSPSTRPSPAEWGWGCRSAGPSSMPMAAGCGQMRLNHRAPCSSSPYQPSKGSLWILFRSVTGLKSRMQALHQLFLVNGFPKITDNAIFQGAGPFNIIWTASNQYCRNRVSSPNEVCVEFNPGHRGHMDVSNQAGRFNETGRPEEIICRPEYL